MRASRRALPLPIQGLSNHPNGAGDHATVAGVAELVELQRHEPGEIHEDLRRLGSTLLQRTGEVIEQITGRAHARRAVEGAPKLDSAVEDRFVRLGTLATAAVARWLAGEPIDVASSVGAEFSRVFAQLVAASDVPLGEVVRRCRYWRDGCDLALREAAELGVAGPEALHCAQESINRAADHALAQMTAIFDGEHRRVQDELRRRQEELAFLATHDDLTGLANRTLLIDRLEQMIALGEREGGVVGVLFIDLNDFKGVNDTFGHAVGDELLAAVAQRLRTVVRESDTLGRLGGDEFVLLTWSPSTEADGNEDLEAVSKRILAAFGGRFALRSGGESLHISASVGVARSQRGMTAYGLLYEADVAMYGAKGGVVDRARRGPIRGCPQDRP